MNVSSTSGHFGRPRAIAYTAAKAGVINLTRSLAIQLAPHNIAVIHAGLGHKDHAFALLDQAYKDRSYYLPTYLATDARMDSLRSDSRFGKLNRRVGLRE